MTVPDCMTEYENLGDKVYSKPRFFNTLRFGPIDRSKYNAVNLKEFFEDVTRRRSEKISNGKRITFPSQRGLCKTLVSLSFSYTNLNTILSPRPLGPRCTHVTLFNWSLNHQQTGHSLPPHRFVSSFKRESSQPGLQTLFLIRSYDHFERTSLDHLYRSERPLSNELGISTPVSNRSDTAISGFSRLRYPRFERGLSPLRSEIGTSTLVSNSSKTAFSSFSDMRKARNPLFRNINYGPAQDFEIWEVARAATAAPFYFDPLKINIRGSSEHMILTDAGFDHDNPTKEGTNEIEWMYGTESIGIVVSVGTARRDEGNLKSGLMKFKPKVKDLAQKATDTERVHLEMDTNSSRDNFLYYRLNDPDGLKMELDEWEPKPSRFNDKSGSKTRETIEIAFTKWAGNNNPYLQTCAKDLVRCRRARSVNRAKWERYATGAEFRCRVNGCPSENFDNCELFQEHLTRNHGVGKKDHKQEVAQCRRDWRYQSAPAPA